MSGVRLTDRQLQALRTMESKGSMVRWPGGFWTYGGASVARTCQGHDVPVWYVGVATLEALRERYLVEITRRNRFDSPDEYTISSAGRSALNSSKGE